MEKKIRTSSWERSHFYAQCYFFSIRPTLIPHYHIFKENSLLSLDLQESKTNMKIYLFFCLLIYLFLLLVTVEKLHIRKQWKNIFIIGKSPLGSTPTLTYWPFLQHSPTENTQLMTHLTGNEWSGFSRVHYVIRLTLPSALCLAVPVNLLQMYLKHFFEVLDLRI